MRVRVRIRIKLRVRIHSMKTFHEQQSELFVVDVRVRGEQ